MLQFKGLFTLASVVPLALAVPTPLEVAPRSTCTTGPTNLQLISQANPETTYSNGNLFYVAQTYDPTVPASNLGGPYTNLFYTLADYLIPATVTNADNVQLVATFPAGSTQIAASSPAPFILADALFSTPSIPAPSQWYWNWIVLEGFDINVSTQGTALGGFFLEPGQTTSISVNVNDFAPIASSTIRLGFQFKIWLPWEENALVFADFGNGGGIFVTYDC